MYPVEAILRMGSRQESKLSLKANRVLSVGNFDVPCNANRLSQPLRRIYRYYSVIALSRISIKSPPNIGNIKTTRIFGYVFIRFLSFVFVFHNILLFGGFYKDQFGELDIFELLESSMWFVGITMPLLIIDPLVRSPDFTQAFTQTMDIMDRIWSDNELPQRGQNEYWKSIFLHNSVLDYFQILNICYFTWGELEYQIYPYSVLPWKNSTTELVSYILNIVQSFFYMLAYSFCWVLPGLLARFIATCVNGITERVRKQGYSYEQTAQDYMIISYSIRRMSDFIKYKLLGLYIVIGAEQSVQFYVILQLLRLGQSFEYVVLMLVDLAITLSRVAHSLHAISSVDAAMVNLRREIQEVSVNGDIVTGLKRKKALNRWRSLSHACMKVGPYSCSNRSVLEALMEFVDYYATAALWR